MVEEERYTYRNIREWAMDSAYDACRSEIIQAERRGLAYIRDNPVDIFGAFFSDIDDSFATELEELMWRTLELILERSLGPQTVRDHCSGIITEILSRNAFDDLVSDIPEDEANELRRDLRLLKFNV